MFITLLLSSAKTSVELFRPIGNRIFTKICLKNSHVATDSVLRQVYYVYIDGIYINEAINCSNDKATFPVYTGSAERDLNFTSGGVMKKTIEYTIFNQTGIKTTDNVVIDLLFEME